MADDNVIKSKIARPQPRPKLVARPHLTTFLDQGHAGGITLITAPAGYGKTTLVASWLERSDRPTAWLSLKEEDNDPAVFCSHFIAAMRSAIPGFGRSIKAMMHPPAPPLETVMAKVVNELASGRRNVILVLDDYDIISNASIHQAMTFLVEHQPQNLQLAVISRSDPAFSLSRLRSQSRLLRLTNEDLRFNADEAEIFFARTMGLSLDRQKVESLVTQTEGWITGLQLAGFSSRHKSQDSTSLEAFSGYSNEVTGFLIREVLSHLPEEIFSFLLHTAVLDRLSVPLCNAVTGRSDASQMLGELEHRHLFLIPLDHKRSWFRYHHLFVEALRAQLTKTTSAETIQCLHANAARWFSDNKLVGEALRHAQNANDPELSASILDRYGFDLLSEGRVTTIATWLRTVPGQIVLKHATLCCLYTFVSLLGDSPEPRAVEPYLVAAERLLAENTGRIPAAEEKAIRGKILLLRGYQARYLGRIDEAMELLRQAADNIPVDDLLYPAALLNQGICNVLSHKFDAAKKVLTPYAVVNDNQPNYWISATSFVGLARINMENGRLNAATDICRTGLQQFRDGGLDKIPVCGVVVMQLGEIAYLQNRLEEATELLEQAIALSSRGGLQLLHGCAHAILTMVRAARGFAEPRLWGQEEELKFFRTWGEIRNIAHPLGIYIAKFWLAQRRLDDVARWLESRNVHETNNPSPPEQEGEYLILARLLCLQHRVDRAIDLLERLLKVAEDDKRQGAAIEILILLALARQSRGENKPAAVAVQQALQYAAPEHFIRPFLDEGEPMRILLKRILLSSEHAGFIRLLLESTATADSSLNLGFAVPLSPKEEQVASFLVTGLSNEEIANRMFLSLNTVKMHLKKLYRKLGVKKRYDAIQKIRASRPGVQAPYGGATNR